MQVGELCSHSEIPTVQSQGDTDIHRDEQEGWRCN